MLDNALILKKPQYQTLPKIRLYTWPYVFGIKMREAEKTEAHICLLISGDVKKRFPFPEMFMIDEKILNEDSLSLVNYDITKKLKPLRETYPTLIYHKHVKNQQNELLLDEIPSGMEMSIFEVDPNSIVYQDVIRSKKRIAVR
jgi:hypothetical protein